MTHTMIQESMTMPSSSAQFSFVFTSRTPNTEFLREIHTDRSAYLLATKYVHSKKERGIKSLSVLDLAMDLGFPVEQANRIIEQLVKEKKIADE